MDSGAINALTKTTTREDEDGFCRTALIVERQEHPASVDVIGPDGEVFCRLNITVKVDGSWGNVDVIWNWKTIPEAAGGKVGTVLAWEKGKSLLNHKLPGASLAAVDINKPPRKWESA